MIKKLFPGTMIALTLGLLLAGMIFKDTMLSKISRKIAPITTVNSGNPEAVFVDSAFNYLKNKQQFQLTFIEFGSTFCGECRKMEEVMQMVRAQYSEKVKVVFVNVNLKENSALTKYFGIVMIPAQVILDNEGLERFRHVGYLSFNKLSDEIDKY